MQAMRWPTFRLSITAALLAYLAVGQLRDIQWRCDAEIKTSDSHVCVVNTSTHDPGPLDLKFKGDVKVDGAFCSSNRRISIQATGKIMIRNGAKLWAENPSTHIELSGTSIECSGKSSVKADQPGSWIVVNATGGAQSAILLEEGSTVSASGRSGARVTLLSEGITIRGKSSIRADGPGGRIIANSSGGTQSEILLEAGSTVSSNDNVTLLSEGITVQGESSVESKTGTVTLGGVTGCSRGIVLNSDNSTTVVHAASDLEITCRDGDVSITGSAAVSSSDVDIDAQTFLLDTGASIAAYRIKIKAAGSVTLNATTMPGVDKEDGAGLKSTKATMSNVSVSTAGDVVLGAGDDLGSWSLGRLLVVANHILIRLQKVHTMGANTCGNRQAKDEDLCSTVLAGWSGHSAKGAAKANEMVSAELSDGVNVTFDMALVSKTDVRISTPQVAAASMIICSKRATFLGQGTHLDVAGRGCPPGDGIGKGETREPSVKCGAGGASHIGEGGWGAKYDVVSLSLCAWGNENYDELGHGLLPTQGASGGGCGVPTCGDIGQQAVDPPPSAGGGLIWLSANHIRLEDNVELNADGTKGQLVPLADIQEQMMLSGGGAGGQIIVFVTNLRSSAAHPATFSAQGGMAVCSKSMVSGGGGGGFIGIRCLGSCNTHINEPIVLGGRLNEECKYLPSSASIDDRYKLEGKPGIAAALKGCAAGYAGFVCNACQEGKYSEPGMSTCADCNSKPGEAQWTQKAWPNRTCPFKCRSNVPNVLHNPACLGAFRYVFEFFGGTIGLVFILLSFSLVVSFMLCRQAVGGRRLASETSQSALDLSALARCWYWMFTQNPIARRVRSNPSFTTASFARQTQAAWQSSSKKFFRFKRNHLPFHICRVYLSGENQHGELWSLNDTLPRPLEEFVHKDAWDSFVVQLNKAAAVHCCEACVNAVLDTIYRPIGSLHALIWRRRRADRLQEVVRTFSSAQLSWKALRLSSDHDFSVVLGSDSGATLAYLDFFDFSRSQLDWDPRPDLRSEARILVAHGQGSNTTPFEIDMMDPLVPDFGARAHAVCRVISTFNKIARLLPAENLGRKNLMAARLYSKVEECAAQYDVSDLVYVLALPFGKSAPPAESSQQANTGEVSRHNEFSEQIRLSPARQVDLLSEPVWNGSSSLVTPSHSSFPPSASSSSLAHTLQSGAEGPKTPLQPDAEQAISESFPPQKTQKHRAAEEVKLCLAFTELKCSCGASFKPGQMFCASCDKARREDLPRARSPAASISVLTSPMAQKDLVDYLAPRDDVPQEDSVNARRHRCWNWYAWGEDAPKIVLVLLALLLFCDILGFLLASSMIYAQSWKLFLLWILVPPLAQPICLVLGPVFVLTERPLLGRLFTEFQLFATISPALMTLLLCLVLQVDSWLFDLIEMSLIVIVKVASCVVAQIHVANLEAEKDLSFVDKSQAHLPGGVLVGDVVFSTIDITQDGNVLSKGDRGVVKGPATAGADKEQRVNIDFQFFKNANIFPWQFSKEERQQSGVFIERSRSGGLFSNERSRSGAGSTQPSSRLESLADVLSKMPPSPPLGMPPRSESGTSTPPTRH